MRKVAMPLNLVVFLDNPETNVTMKHPKIGLVSQLFLSEYFLLE